MKLSPKTLAEDIKNVTLTAELQKFYDEYVAEMADLYGEDETIDELIDKFTEKANAWLTKKKASKGNAHTATPHQEADTFGLLSYRKTCKILERRLSNFPSLNRRLGATQSSLNS